MALIWDANLKFSLSKICGHSRPKVLNNVWVLKQDTCPKRCLYSRLKASNAISTFQESRLNKGQEGHVSTSIKSRVSSALRAASQPPLKFTSPLDQYDNRICESCVHSQTHGVRPCFCNQFNSTLARAIDNSTG